MMTTMMMMMVMAEGDDATAAAPNEILIKAPGTREGRPGLLQCSDRNKARPRPQQNNIHRHLFRSRGCVNLAPDRGQRWAGFTQSFHCTIGGANATFFFCSSPLASTEQGSPFLASELRP